MVENMHYILDGHAAVPCKDMGLWSKWMSKASRRVKLTDLPTCKVSTVFLGINHSIYKDYPLLFETMIFGGQYAGEQRRYATWEEAEKGHDTLVAEIIEINRME